MGVAARGQDDAGGIGVGTVEREQIEVALVGFEQRIGNEVGQAVDVVALLAHEIIDGLHVAGADVAADFLVSRSGCFPGRKSGHSYYAF